MCFITQTKGIVCFTENYKVHITSIAVLDIMRVVNYIKFTLKIKKRQTTHSYERLDVSIFHSIVIRIFGSRLFSGCNGIFLYR